MPCTYLEGTSNLVDLKIGLVKNWKLTSSFLHKLQLQQKYASRNWMLLQQTLHLKQHLPAIEKVWGGKNDARKNGVSDIDFESPKAQR